MPSGGSGAKTVVELAGYVFNTDDGEEDDVVDGEDDDVVDGDELELEDA